MSVSRMFLVVCWACATAACGAADPTDGVDAGVTASSQALMMCGNPRGCTTIVTVDCRQKGDATCYECGNKNGVMCCLSNQPCTIVK